MCQMFGFGGQLGGQEGLYELAQHAHIHPASKKILQFVVNSLPHITHCVSSLNNVHDLAAHTYHGGILESIGFEKTGGDVLLGVTLLSKGSISRKKCELLKTLN